MLEISNLSKSFYQGKNLVKVVNGVNISVKKGEVFGFLGPNGAGKTTTVKMIADLLFPDDGTITVGGKSSKSLSAKKIYGFMPEQPQFYYHLTSEEVLHFVGEIFELNEKTITKRIKELLNKVGLNKARKLQARKFSKGMQQRLAFAVALMNDPELLIMDEPLDGLDPLGRLDFKRLITELKNSGKTVFFSSHILSDVEELCDRIAIIRQGKIIETGSPKQLVKKSGKKTLEEMFVERIRSNA
jgi:ABC-2 type transport system ATP-binding protein